MASPLQTGKQPVKLASGGVRISRIRRDPPPKVKEKAVLPPDERDRRVVVIGVLTFTLALVIIVFGFSSYNGWSPREYTVHW